ncbi:MULTISPECIES: DUF935 domain-containing protein [unclassified Paracoccus (in: a-proteobacteria)]|uniref:DUF935 domain-containing protein n=1 Tax=unclassified Paracoccus (in: a-proteobacteria) TaxID=2688777 RepID=UPI0012B24015|nr:MULTISPECIES: DUF935 domain-containing protein [unclassified Paracoccus (in: a-proteobacteria)]UXU74352.1 DUF935 domain-containing protein [Paracoccus sp. SMMA_5]UXU80242.1 DUF935 domain-containing protein [Paracoccus sp. SMMA_5_TC]
MALLDAFGRPIRTQALTRRLAEPGMTGIRQVWAGSAASGLTPQRLATILRACDQGDLTEFLTLAEEMEERDPHYLSVMGTRKRVISGITPIVKPGGDDARAKEIAEAVQAHIADHEGLPDLIEDLLDALGKSFSVVELDWARGSRLWTFNGFIHRDPRHFVFDRETGCEIRLLDDAEPVDGVALAPAKFAVHRARIKSGLTWRGGLARVVAFAWMCKQYTLKDWIAFIETYGLPLRLGRYGPEATAEDVRKLFQAVANIGTDAAAVLPKAMEIEFENGPSATGDKLFETFARWTDEQISKAVLGQTMTADSGSSQAQAKVHDEVRHDIAVSDARAVTGTINRDIVRPFVDLNFGVQEVYPRLILSVDEPEDVKAKIDGAVSLAGIGVTFKASELRRKLGFSDPEQGDEVVGGLPGAPSPSEPGRLALNRSGGAGDDIDEIEAGMVEDWQELADDLQAAVATVMDGAASYEDALKRLPEALKAMPTGLAVETLIKGLFLGRALGDVRDG